MIKILDVEEDPLQAKALAAVLADEYNLVHCANPALAPESASKEGPAAILFDLDCHGAQGLDILGRLAGKPSGPPVIAMSSRAEPRSVVRAVRLGASDFISKPLKLAELKAALRSAIVPSSSSPFIGESPASLRAAALIKNYARFDYPVLVLGESGTGKDLAARALHASSQRAGSPFVARNCAAFPEELIESELFGSARGAFTGAVERPGAFELAESGTLFLDEIGEAGASTQAKLLRVLESGDLWRLGDKKPRHTNIRLVSATSRNLKEAVVEGHFRADLFYRIDTLILELPALRTRKEDIPGLADHFAHCAVGSRKVFSRAAYEKLSAQDWPGNVRQLKNAVHRAIVLSGDLELIGEEHIIVD